MAFLIKFLSLPIYPIGFITVMLITGIITQLMKKRCSIWFYSIAGVSLLLFSSGFISNFLIASLERPYFKQSQLPTDCSALVVLGGAGKALVSPRTHPEINEAGDRLIHCYRLYKNGVCRRIITTGGWVDPKMKNIPSEGMQNALLLQDFGVNREDIIIEQHAKNTHEHGPYIAAILDSLNLPRKIILVTSASHMIRSIAVFKKSGFTVYPAATDFQYAETKPTFLFDIFPNANALALSTTAFHEYYGIIGYKLLRWIK